MHTFLTIMTHEKNQLVEHQSSNVNNINTATLAARL